MKADITEGYEWNSNSNTLSQNGRLIAGILGGKWHIRQRRKQQRDGLNYSEWIECHPGTSSILNQLVKDLGHCAHTDA